MTRNELIQALADRHGLTRKVAGSVVHEVLRGLREPLCAGSRVEIRGFGSLRARHYPGYRGRNPRTGERVVVDHKVLPVFRVGRGLFDRVNRIANEEG
ncbi:MAG: integration host factor subunit beta [Deltaproteobacteria bacterium]|nr:integration host factor subunit beta [Deltaproteobacteria bacterium]MBW2255555.1 integration host factor subunit beta [Deltaproteobacteria bacterium]